MNKTTEQTQHTPGPWTIHQFKDGVIELTQPDGSMVCYIEKQPKFQGAAERNANARLIAAAPDLLAALRDVVASSDANDGDSMANAISAARAAIAQAEERAS